MAEIKVIEDDGRSTDLELLAPEERELIFINATRGTDVSIEVVRNFIDMFDEIIRDKIRTSKPELRELLLRKIINLGRGHGSTYNTLAVPVIPPIGTKLSPHGIRVKFDEPIIAVCSDGLDYIVPSGREVVIIGLVTNGMCTEPMGLSTRLPLDVRLPMIRHRLPVGTYNHPMAARSCDGYFLQSKYVPMNRLMFGADDPSDYLNKMFDVIVEHDDYINTSAPFIYAQLGATLSGSSARPGLRDALFALTFPSPRAELHVPVKPKFATLLETMHYGRFDATYAGAFLADIDMRGFARAYYKSLVRGEDHTSVREYLNAYKAHRARIAFQTSVNNKLIDEHNKLNVYKSIIEKKLGAKRLKEVEGMLLQRPSLTVLAKNILTLLRPSERKPIEVEYERRAKYLDAVINNKCPHVKLYQRFRRAASNDRVRELYNKLSQFFKDSRNDMIMCNNCGFEIMCPHVRDYTELELANKYYTEIKAKLSGYVDRASSDQYYCRICGESISAIEEFEIPGQERDTSSLMDEELKNFMWGEIAMLTKFLKFESLVNVPHLITAIRDACYPYIFDIEKQILKSKTNSADEVKAKRKLFVTIYAFAYMIHLVSNNKKSIISFRNFTSRSSNVVVDMIKYALDNIVLSRNIIIRNIPGITNDLIRNKLIEAYKSLQATPHVITQTDDASDRLTTLMLDPIYKYFYFINVLSESLAGKKLSKNKYDVVERVDEILGAPLASLGDVFSKVKIPNMGSWNTKAFDSIKPIVDARTTIGGKSIYESAYLGYVVRSFELFYEKIKNGLASKYMYIDVSPGHDATIVDLRDDFKTHRAHYLKFAALEDILINYRLMESAVNFIWPNRGGSRRWDNPTASLGRLFDEDGEAHVWSIYVTAAGDVKISDINKIIQSGKKYEGVVTDKKCAKCGVLWSRVNDLDESKIVEALDARHTVNNFFRFYENRCPVSGLHEFTEGTCRKCDFNADYITNTTSKGALSYYKKYKLTYLGERNEFAQVDTARSAPKPPADVSAYEGLSKWVSNFNIILDLANKLKIKDRLIMSLGAVERQEYADVVSGEYLPPEAEERNDTRIFVLNTHIKNLITEYNQLKYFHRLNKPSIELTTIVNDSGINKHKISELAQMLPDIYDDYNNKYAYFHRNRKPRDIVSFCIQSLCEMCLVIWNDGAKETEKLRHDFVEYYIRKIIRAEELTSKPGYFNMSLLFGSKDTKSKESYDSNVSQEEDGDDLSDDDAGSTAKPFDTHFDVETDPSADDDDDSSNDWKVGDDYGL